MPAAEPGSDPFLAPRDPGEAAADAAMREFLLVASPPAAVARKSPGGYALVVPNARGIRTVTVPAANEADFTYHGDAGMGADAFADFVAAALADSGADQLRLPLLSEAHATWLRDRLTTRLPDWAWGASLAALSPMAEGSMRQERRLLRALARAEREGLVFETATALDPAEVQALHTRLWGPGNRSGVFFRMLAALLSAGCAELVTARGRAGELVAAQLDILGSATRHYYYSVADLERAPGCGTAVLAASWRRLRESGTRSIYSFGRGSERYKYQYANGHRALFELRGFYAPV
jgi:hypothetical protein